MRKYVHRSITTADLAALLCALGFTSCFLAGPPILRHDWPSPYHDVWAMLATLSGWDPTGIGSPVGYPSSFLAAAFSYGLTTLLGAYTGTLLWQLSIALVCAFGAQACVRASTTSPIAQSAAAVFALFNPWVYNEVVAGHAFMLLAYGGTFWLVREALKPTSETRLILCGLLIVPQIQFFVLEWPLLLYIALRDRRPRAAATWALLSLPIVTGILTTRHTLVQTPLTVAWERSQSIAASKAIVLMGYFTHYASFSGIAAAGMWLVFGLAALGACAIFLYDPRRRPVPVLTALFIAIAVGLNAPWGIAVHWAFSHVPESGLLRELYDLLGLAAVGYVALCSGLCMRARIAAAAWLVGSLLIASAWLTKPPSTFWIPATQLPKLAVEQPQNTRFALLPAFQPMQWMGRGSGVDPDNYVRGGNVTPLNEFLAVYPVNAALARFMLSGDARALAALSVARVYARPYLQTNVSTIRFQFALEDAALAAKLKNAAQRSRTLDALPELTLSAPPSIGTLDSNTGAGNVFFGDQPGAQQSVFAVKVSNDLVNARDGWVDARLAFSELPEIAQAFGGALTTNSKTSLPIGGGMRTLVWVRGKLVSTSGNVLTKTTRGYAWIGIPAGVTAVRCIGMCVVALQGNPPAAPLNPAAHPASGVAFRSILPWLAVADVPATDSQRLLRYNVAYDPHWSAYAASHSLPHLRIDAIVNGWLLPPLPGGGRIVMIETGAALIALAEILCVLGLAALLLPQVALDRNAARVVDTVQ